MVELMFKIDNKVDASIIIESFGMNGYSARLKRIDNGYKIDLFICISGKVKDTKSNVLEINKDL